ncbi:MAG: hypothetical protein ACK4WF_00870 [Candidatus Brocadiales bacterium]
MAGFLKIAAFSVTGVFIIFFAMIFFTRLGQGKGYKFFVAELAMLTTFLWASVADPHFKFFDLPFILPFAGCFVSFIIASVLFGKAVFSQPSQNQQGQSQ